MKIEMNLSEFYDVLSILGVWAEDMTDICPEEALRTRNLIFRLEAQRYQKPNEEAVLEVHHA